jgi:acyl-coenzyme A thioesterase 9
MRAMRALARARARRVDVRGAFVAASGASAPTAASVDASAPPRETTPWRWSSSSSSPRWMSAGVSRERTAMTTKLWNARLAAAKAAGVDSNAATETSNQAALVSKPPVATSVRYRFTSDDALLEAYRSPWNAVRIGRVLEDLDSLAGNIAFQHCDDGVVETRPQLLVTASVDRVRLHRALRLDEDLTLTGAVSWVGRSSMVIRMEAWPADHPAAPREYIDDDGDGGGDRTGGEKTRTTAFAPGPSLSADFTFVARDPVTNKSAAVNPLVPDCARTRALFDATAARVDAKKRRMRATRDAIAAGKHADAGLSDETRAAKKAFADALAADARTLAELPALAPRDVVPSSATRTENIFVAQPQQRNLSGRIFGGFLLRRAFELAFATTYVFGGDRPVFKQVSDMDFLRPVDVGDLLRLKSRVLHASVSDEDEHKRSCVDVEVEAFVTKPERAASEVSNTFLFKFYVGAGGEGGATVTRRVAPMSREDAEHVWERCERPKLQAEADEESGGSS